MSGRTVTDPAEPAAIELGVFHYDPEAGTEGEPPPGYAMPRPRWAYLAARFWRPAAVLVAVAGLLAGATVPVTPPAVVRVWTLPATGSLPYTVADDGILYVAERAGSGRLVAYRLADGTRLWEVPLAEPSGYQRESLWLSSAGAVPLSIASQLGTLDRVTAYDPATGGVRWSESGYVNAVLPGDRILFTRPVPAAFPRDDGTFPGDGAFPYDVLVVEAGTGAVAWGRRFASGHVLLPRAGEPAQLLVLGPDGTLTRYDPGTGAVLARSATGSDQAAREPPVTVVEAYAGEASLTLVLGFVGYPPVDPGELVLPEPGAIAGYDPMTLARRWRLGVSGPAWAARCGELVCRFQGADRELAGVDPVTGRTEWSRPCGPTDPPAGDDCVLLPIGPAGRDLLVRRVTVTGGEVAVETLAVDPATGEILGRLPDWRPLWFGSGQRWLLGYEEPAAPVREEDLGPPWVVRWNADPPGFQVRGPIDADWCEQPHGAHLVCLSEQRQTLEVWRAG